MNSLESNNWIAQLKAGDTVIIHTRYQDTIHIVDKVTPAGKVKIKNTYFDKRGIEIGHSRWDWSELYKATPEAIAKVVEAQTISKARYLAHNVSELSYEQAVKLLELLRSEEVQD